MDDQTRDWARAAAKGDAEALSALLDRYLPDVRAFVRLRTGPELRAHESCSDVVQSVCREILEHADVFEHPSENGFKRWLYATALRKIQARYRHWGAEKREAARATPLSEGSDQELLDRYGAFTSPSHRAIVREEVERIESAFEHLPEDYREVITLAHIVGLSRSEIAEHMGRSEGAVRTLLHRALVSVAAALDR